MVALLQVECLEQVVRTKSFRGAAQALHMSQPAVSGHIARLERELQLNLLERGPSGSLLTAEGERILPHLRAFAESSELIRRASAEIHGVEQQTLTILGETRHLHVILPDTLSMLKRQYADLTVRVETKSEDEVYRAIRSGQADLGVIVLEDPQTVPDDITAVPMFDLGPLGVAARPGCAALAGTIGPIDAHLLDDEPLITLTNDKAMDVAIHYLPPANRPGVSVVDDIGVGIDLVRHGLGVMALSSITTYMIGPDIDWRELVGAPVYTGYIVHGGEARMTQAARAFMEYLRIWTTKYGGDFHHNRVTGRLEVSAGMRRLRASL